MNKSLLLFSSEVASSNIACTVQLGALWISLTSVFYKDISYIKMNRNESSYWYLKLCNIKYLKIYVTFYLVNRVLPSIFLSLDLVFIAPIVRNSLKPFKFNTVFFQYMDKRKKNTDLRFPDFSRISLYLKPFKNFEYEYKRT